MSDDTEAEVTEMPEAGAETITPEPETNAPADETIAPEGETNEAADETPAEDTALDEMREAIETQRKRDGVEPEPEALADAVTEAKPEPKAEPKAEKPADAPKAEAAPDEDIPAEELAGMTAGARTRVESLLEQRKALREEVEQATQTATQTQEEHGKLIGILRDTQASPEQLGQHFDFLRAVNSGDYTKALDMAQAQLTQLAQLAGRDVPGLDPLAEHPDLKEAVDAFQIDEKYARELAMARNAPAARSAYAEQQTGWQAQLEAEQTKEAEVTQATQALTALETELKRDPDYARKRELLNDHLVSLKERVPPAQWADEARRLFDLVGHAAEASRRATPSPAPLSVRGGAANGAGTQLSPLDAMREGIARARARA